MLQIRLFWVVLVKRRNFDVGVKTPPQSSSFSVEWKIFWARSFSHRAFIKEDIPRGKCGAATLFAKLHSSIFFYFFLIQWITLSRRKVGFSEVTHHRTRNKYTPY